MRRGKGSARPVISALARTLPEDILKAAEAVSEARPPHTHVHRDVSIHMKYKLRKEPRSAGPGSQAVALAKKYVDDVEFSLKMRPAAIGISFARFSPRRSKRAQPRSTFPTR